MSVILCTDDLDGDLVLLDEVTESATVQKLNDRFKADKIYTAIGPVLVAINPYKKVCFKNGQYVCDPKVITAYQGREMHEMAPHPFGVASECSGRLKMGAKNQCIIITGESGAGKTETSKFIMEFICATSSFGISSQRNLVISESDQVKNILLASNPVLEAFGNAQTIRNNNSSRFGKYMVLQFNFAQEVVGGYITNYLLEKSRVVQQADGERNFHVFYQMLAGSDAAKKAAWKVDDASRHRYLSNEHRKIAGTDDAKMMALLLEQLTTCGISEGNQDAIFAVLSGLLHAGDLAFKGDDEAEITNVDVLQKMAHNLGLPDDVVADCVLNRTISVGTERHKVPLEPEQAQDTRDSLSKALYERIFQFLVQEINHKMDSKSSNAKSIGILDIYGFEIFESNSFEQMCINYVNEKLQQVFVELTLKAEQEEYTREGIEWEPVKYFDNKTVCDLIESNRNPVGILALLDEQCLIANPTDKSWLNKINQLYDGKHAHFKKTRMAGTEFIIAHYAGDVKYSVEGFIHKNRDTLFNDVIAALQQSNVPFLAKLFEDNRTDLEKKKRPPTTATMFKSQVNALMATLTACEPHYIRTIKPNDVKKPGVFTTDRVQHQVKYLGLVENIRIRRAGFAYRNNLERFLARFKAISPKTWPFPADRSMNAGPAVEMLLLDSDNVKWYLDPIPIV
jgi:myosin-1